MLLSITMSIGLACGDDTTVATSGPQDTDSTTSGGTSPSTVTLTTVDPTVSMGTGADTSGTGGTGADSTATDGTTGDGTTTGGEAIPGQSINQLVSAGERSVSESYTLVYTFGQPSTVQSTLDSESYRIHGGLIGANGSPP